MCILSMTVRHCEGHRRDWQARKQPELRKRGCQSNRGAQRPARTSRRSSNLGRQVVPVINLISVVSQELKRLWLTMWRWQDCPTRRPQRCSGSWITTTRWHRPATRLSPTLKKMRHLPPLCCSVNCAATARDAYRLCANTTRLATERRC